MNRNKLGDKTEYGCVDYFRLICAIGIVALHMDPFADINSHANFWVGSVLTRLCVPFFFLAAGYFLKDKPNDWSRTRDYIWRLIKLYLLYSILYLPIKIQEYLTNDRPIKDDIISYIRKFFFVGSYAQLWYFPALIFSAFLLWLLVAKLNLKTWMMIALSTILYLIGTFGRVYDKPIRDLLDEIWVFHMYDEIFDTYRNGLFFGFPLVFLGNCFWKKKDVIKNRNYALYFAISLLALSAEAVFVRRVIGAKELDLLILLPVTVAFMFLGILFFETKRSKFAFICRSLSVIIFGGHMLLIYGLSVLLESHGRTLHSMLSFLIVLSVNVLIGVVIIKASEKKGFGWLKVFYN